MDRQRIIEKAAKCFALANAEGATTNEAETALRQARWLMDQYNLQETELQAWLATETSISAGTRRQPPDWLHSLARTCANAFGCDYLAYSASSAGYSFKFVGVGVSPELAAYAYAALHQQLLIARRKHVSQQKRCKLATKRRRGQLFAEAWISAVADKVDRFAGRQPEETVKAIEAYLSLHHPNLKYTEPKQIPVRGQDYLSLDKGREQGSTAYLHQGVGKAANVQYLRGGK